MDEPGAPPRGPGRPAAGGEPLPTDEQLFTRALEGFAEHGFDAMSVRELCRDLGVSHNHVQQRFGSKAALWDAAIDFGFANLLAELATAVGAEQPDGLARLRAVWIRFVEVCAESPHLIRIVNAEATSDTPRLDRLHDRFLAPATELMGAVMAPLVDAGEIRPVDAGTLYFLVGHGAGGPLVLGPLGQRFGIHPTDRDRVRAYATEVIDLILAGLRAPEN